MSSPESEILHVSDTALMVAACRALETARPNGIIRDPFAERLAGIRGMAMARALSGLELMCFGIAARTYFLDELVANTIAGHSIATVLSIGAGLDARPWRLDLPAGLRWIEIDFPDMIEYKSALLASEIPRCRLERLAADLTDPLQRNAVFAAAGDTPALMITEGLLMYLPGDTVEALAVEPARDCGVRHWLMDTTSQAFARRVHMASYQSIENVRASGHLDAEQTLDVIRRAGWTTEIHRSYAIDVAARIPRVRLEELMTHLPPMQEPPPPLAGDPSGVYLFGR
jgi:methyltransferase (TIGR00027 family)